MAKAAKTATKVTPLADLRTQLTDKRKALVDYRRHHAAGELANARVIGVTRKEIARLETAIRAAELAAGNSATKEDN